MTSERKSRKKLEPDFEEGTSQNLPVLDLEMFADFFCNNPNFFSAEMRGVKALRSARETYGDAAVGEVQIKRTEKMCTVRATVCPEHKLHDAPYRITVVIDEEKETVKQAICRDCVASAGGCKHAIALLAWLLRRSEEPSPTSIECYWKKSKLSKVGTSIKGLSVEDIIQGKKQSTDDSVSDSRKKNTVPAAAVIDVDAFICRILTQGALNGCNSQIVLDHKPPSVAESLSLHHMSLRYTGDKENYEQFMKYCQSQMTYSAIVEIEKLTRSQCDEHLWHELRFGRITASVLYSSTKCKTGDGSVVEKIMGSRTPDTAAMKRGRELEPLVIQAVEKKLKCRIKKSGLLLSNRHPVLGASPDGLTDTHVIEVKCPMKVSTVKNYYNNRIMPMCRAQLQLGMMLAKKKRISVCCRS